MELLIPGLSFLASALLVWGLRAAFGPRPRTVRERLARYARPAPEARPQLATSITRGRRRLSAIAGLDRVLSKGGYADRVAVELSRADVPLRVGEYLLLRWCVALGAGYLGLRASGLLPVALLFAAVGYMVPRLYVAYRRAWRARRLDEQLVEALTLMASSLRAGYSFLQALEAVTREYPPPIGEEFRLLLEDISVGVPTEEALVGLAERAHSEELDIAVTAMLIQRATGGNLAEILDTLAATIRDRLRIRREVQTLSAQERYSSYIVGALPLFMFLLIGAMNPDYLYSLFGTSMGQALLVAALFFEITGFLVIRRIMDIEV